jgi:hypothetical protein
MLESCLLSERQGSLSELLAIQMQWILLACYKLPERQALCREEAIRVLERGEHLVAKLVESFGAWSALPKVLTTLLH